MEASIRNAAMESRTLDTTTQPGVPRDHHTAFDKKLFTMKQHFVQLTIHLLFKDSLRIRELWD